MDAPFTSSARCGPPASCFSGEVEVNVYEILPCLLGGTASSNMTDTELTVSLNLHKGDCIFSPRRATDVVIIQESGVNQVVIHLKRLRINSTGENH